MNPKLFISTLLCMLLFIASCEEESPAPIIEEDEPGFFLHAFDEPLSEILRVNWEEYNEVQIKDNGSSGSSAGDEQWREYRTTLKGYMTLEDSIYSNDIFFTLVERKMEDGPSDFVLLKFVPANGYKSSGDIGYFNLGNFSGTIYGFDQYAELSYVLGITEGRVGGVADAKPDAVSSSARVQKAPPLPSSCPEPRDPACQNWGDGGGYWESITVEIVTDIWFFKTIVGSSSYSLTYGGSEYSTEVRQVWVSDSFYSSSGPRHEHISGGTAGAHGSSVHPNEFMRARRLELESMIDQDPFAWIKNCDQIEEWRELAQHLPPQEVLDKLQNLDDSYLSILSGDWNVQQLADAQGPVVNMDYFSVDITQFPLDPATGQRFTPEGFFDYVRRNLNSFFEGNSTSFGPYNNAEKILWNSNNYLGGIMRFDINVELFGIIPGQQDGSVICSDRSLTGWTFTTIESPVDWNHPVSGNREFGLVKNGDGTYTFFTRGVDRVAELFDILMGNAPNTNDAFKGADLLWTTFQENLESFVNNPENDGQANVQNPKIDRVDWELIKDVLLGEKPISDIGCN